ncbi:MAG: 1,4-dihydroxy-6-naphthoate synthase [Bacteroidales bacterium]|nr:1,4-dihydroxy-6-naphthoate synthase [Bacteroidales bacterium]MBN2748367.1 1,4-dihydroxy-6-naphthoate synthase [Bacteroidales bacterium]
MKLTLSFSTCPNDTFMFDALVNKRIDLRGFEFDVALADIEELNTQAQKALPDITKISINAFGAVSGSYQLLSSGSALGSGVGPLVISKRKIYPDEVKYAKVAIPGLQTTANLLFSLAYPDAQSKKVYLFSDIEDVVLSNEADIGVVIHESRFTYHKRGLVKLNDLGDFWERETSLPIPLGGIAIRRDLPSSVKLAVQSLVAQSVTFAFANPEASAAYVRSYAQEMDMDVMRKHIQLYVNRYSVDLGDSGRSAINFILEKGRFLNFFNELVTPVFV